MNPNRCCGKIAYSVGVPQKVSLLYICAGVAILLFKVSYLVKLCMYTPFLEDFMTSGSFSLRPGPLKSPMYLYVSSTSTPFGFVCMK